MSYLSFPLISLLMANFICFEKKGRLSFISDPTVSPPRCFPIRPGIHLCFALPTLIRRWAAGERQRSGGVDKKNPFGWNSVNTCLGRCARSGRRETQGEGAAARPPSAPLKHSFGAKDRSTASGRWIKGWEDESRRQGPKVLPKIYRRIFDLHLASLTSCPALSLSVSCFKEQVISCLPPFVTASSCPSPSINDVPSFPTPIAPNPH